MVYFVIKNGITWLTVGPNFLLCTMLLTNSPSMTEDTKHVLAEDAESETMGYKRDGKMKYERNDIIVKSWRWICEPGNILKYNYPGILSSEMLQVEVLIEDHS
jgi:hypothetical protein